MGERITLYTGQHRIELFKNDQSFWASDVKLYDTDSVLIVNKDDIEFVSQKPLNCTIYEVVRLESVVWTTPYDPLNDSVEVYEHGSMLSPSVITVCDDCGVSEEGKRKQCSDCGSTKVEHVREDKI